MTEPRAHDSPLSLIEYPMYLTIHGSFDIVERLRNRAIMCKKALPTVLVGLSWLLSQAALADPAYKATDIIQHFAPNAGLGQSRGLCIGHEGECNGAAMEGIRHPPAGFDLI